MNFLERLRGKKRRPRAEEDPSPGVDDRMEPPLAEDARDDICRFSFVDRGAVALDDRVFAANLKWIPRGDGGTLKESLALASEQALAEKGFGVEFDLFQDNRGSDFIAFGSRDAGHRKGMAALIDMFDERKLGPRWLVVLPLADAEDIYWIGSKRDGGVFEDTVAMSRSAATDILMEYLSAPGWSTIVAPEAWSVEGSVPRITRDALLPKPLARLRYIFPLKVHAPKIIGGAILLAAIATGAVYYLDQRARHQAEMRELQQRIQRAVSLGPSDFPWYGRTTLPDFMTACMEAIEQNLIVVPGWENQPFTCRVSRGNAVLDMGWRIAPTGNIAWITAAMPPDYPELSFNEPMTEATVSIPFAMDTDPDALAEEPWDRQLIERRMRERFQLRGMEHSLRYVQDRRDPSVNALFHRHDMQVSGRIDPRDFAGFLDDIPATIPETLSYNVANSGWSLILRLHHPVIVPEIQP